MFYSVSHSFQPSLCFKDPSVFLCDYLVSCFPGGSVVKNLPANARDTGDMGSIPELERCSRVLNGSPLQYSCLENPIDRGAWWAIVIGVTKSRI